ncbi:unnamed protein product [Microthlaspi erraticum]|uniref:HAT C-terminal dimerisation domain-containing protein n=1 Tax=Microthlaspi erraticum TaxID=1685480 RepID=A0A6D2KRT9_9BRAS|nr:unnamed protein product [Microthlaspi erraticum]
MLYCCLILSLLDENVITLARKGCEKKDENFDPGNWWVTYGCETPHLRRLATRILALTSSSSGCERNWSCFGAIHTKKRNRLDVDRLNSLVYVQFNARLFKKQKKIRESKCDVIFDEGNEDTVEDWILDRNEEVDGDVPLVPTSQAPQARALYDDDFESDEEEGGGMEFQSDYYHEDPVFRDPPFA